MADDRSDKKIKQVTDPQEVKKVFDNEGKHRRALEENGRERRTQKALERLAKKVMSGKMFNIVWHKIEERYDVESNLLRGHIQQSRDQQGQHYNLTLSVDYKKLYQLNPSKKEELAEKDSITIKFKQQRASVLCAGSFDSLKEAKNYMQLLDLYLMHVLAEQGAEQTLLQREQNKIIIKDEPQNASDQKYSDALKTARLAEIFRSVAIDARKPDFNETVGKLLPVLLDTLGLPYERKEYEQADKTHVQITFDKDIGTFSFIDNGPGKEVTMKHEIRAVNDAGKQKVRYEGSLTSECLQTQFTDWIAAAAREQGTISAQEFENLYGGIKAVKGISLRRSKLGPLAPFATAPGQAGPQMGIN